MRSQGTRGFALIAVVVMLTVLASVSLMILSASNLEMTTDAQLNETQNLRYAAEAGLEHVAWSLNQHSGCAGYQGLSKIRMGDAWYEATLSSDSGSPVDFESTAYLASGASKVLRRFNVPVYDQVAVQTLEISGAPDVRDTYLEGENGHHDHNKETDNKLSVNAETGKVDRALLYFNLANVPPDVRIESAVLELDINNNGFADEVNVHRVLRDWTDAGATWLTYNGSDDWDTSGGDFEAESASSFLVDGLGVKSVDLTDLVSAWTSGQFVNYGIILVSPEEAGGKPNEFVSSDDASGAGPKLTVRYSCECGQSCVLSEPGVAPVAHWQMNDGSGLKAFDSRGDHSGSLENGPYWSDLGQLDGALEFDGLNDGVRVPHADALSLTDAFTLSGWVRNDSLDMSGSYRIVSKESTGSNDSYWLSVSGGQVWLGVGGEFFTDGSVLTSGTWHHVAATFDRDEREIRMYFDGVETLTQSTNAKISANSDPVYLGTNWETFKSWYGALDDVRLYDVVLTDTEIADLATLSSTNSGSKASGIYRDEFNERDYAGDDGTLRWASDWLEINESDGPFSGDERIRSDDDFDYVLRVQDNDGGGEGVQREADLSSCATAGVSFDYRREGLDRAEDYVLASASRNGGTSWTEIGRFEGDADDDFYLHFSADLTGFMSSRTRIAFITSSSLGGSDRVYLDNVTVTCD